MCVCAYALGKEAREEHSKRREQPTKTVKQEEPHKVPSQVWDQSSGLGFKAPSCCLEIHNNFVFECVLLKSTGTMEHA